MRNITVFVQTLCYRIINPLYSYGVYGPAHIALLLLKQYPLYVRLNTWWAGGVLPWLHQPVTIRGKEHIEQADPDKRYLILANHACYLDISTIISLFKNAPVTWVVKESLLAKPIVGQVIQLGVGTPIPRANARASQDKILQHTAKLRQEMNPHIAVFPEGTRTRDGKLAPFKRGFTLLMRQYQMDILPITLCGFYTFSPRNGFWTNPDANIEVIIHPPVPFSSIKDEDDKTIAKKMEEIIASAYHP